MYKVDDVKNIVVKSLDLSALMSIRAFADDFLATESRLDFLVLNAGVMALPTLERTGADFEKQMGVNHFGHAYLFLLLEPLLSKQPFTSRVVVLTSSVHAKAIDTGDLNFADSSTYSPLCAYRQSKLANIMFAKVGLVYEFIVFV